MKMDNRHKDFFGKIHNLPYFGTNPIVLYNAAKNSEYLLQRLTHRKLLKSHSGCVNTISWNSTGRYILSGSDDLNLAITDTLTGVVKTKIRTGHATNIFSAKYLPNTDDTKVVSCSGDGMVIYTDLNCPETACKNIFDCQTDSLFDIVTVPNDPNTFLTCSQNKTVRWYDLRTKESCKNHHLNRNRHPCVDDVLVTCDCPVTAIAVNQLMPWQLAVGCSDAVIRIYDRRMLSTTTLGRTLSKAQQNASIVAKFTYDGLKGPNRITSLAYSRNCQQLLASFSNENVYLFNLYDIKKTVSFGKEDDVIAEKPQHVTPPSKRFRLRGDWTGTGPNSLTNEEQRLLDQNNANNENNTSPNISVASQQSNTSNSSSSSTNSDQSSSSNRSSGSLRQLSGILNMLFGSVLPDSNESLHENNEDNQSTTTSTSMQNNHDNSSTSTASSTASTATNTAQQTSSTIVDDTLNPPMVATRASIVDNYSESSSDSLRFFMIFDNDSNSMNMNRNNEDDNESSDFNIGEIMIEDDSDLDSDNNSVFDSDPTAPDHEINNDANMPQDQEQRQRTRSSSSNESYRNIYHHRVRNQQQQKQISIMSSDKLAMKQKKRQEKRDKRAQVYKIKNFKKFTGHRNARTVIKEATFWGDDYIISGSDCGHIFFWSIETGEVVMILQGDQHVVNCLQPHPTEPILASSGIDYDIKIWGPDSEENLFSSEYAEKLIERNKYMLEHNEDTVTVPARFVLRLFSSMQQRQQRIRNMSRREYLASRMSGEFFNPENMNDY